VPGAKRGVPTKHIKWNAKKMPSEKTMRWSTWVPPVGKCNNRTTEQWCCREVKCEGRGSGLPSTIRTCDLRLRRPLLYPTELWAARRKTERTVDGLDRNQRDPERYSLLAVIN
jgi:hypothetical protein